MRQGASFQFRSDPQPGPESPLLRKRSPAESGGLQTHRTYKSPLRSCSTSGRSGEARHLRAPAAICPWPSLRHNRPCPPGAAQGWRLVSLSTLGWGGIAGLGPDGLSLRITVGGSPTSPLLPESPPRPGCKDGSGSGDHLCRALNGPFSCAPRARGLSHSSAAPRQASALPGLSTSRALTNFIPGICSCVHSHVERLVHREVQ